MQPSANRIGDANRRLAEMKLDLLRDPVCWKPFVMLAINRIMGRIYITGIARNTVLKYMDVQPYAVLATDSPF
jgi:hypothetical protein